MAVTISLVGLLTCFYLVTRSGAQLECGERNRTATDVFRNLTFIHNATGFQNGNTCTWTIEAEDESYILNTKVTITDINFAAVSCSKYTNNISVYDGPVAAGEPIYTWCMEETPSVTSTGKYLTFQLSLSLFLMSGATFSLRYKQEALPEMCEATLTTLANFNVFTSQGYPKGLHKNQNCSILITTSHYNGITLTVIDADVGFSCIYFYDGSTQSAPLLNSMCGTDVLTLSSTGDKLLVEYSTGDNPIGRGFKMKYQSFKNRYDCSHRQLTAGTNRLEIKSPLFPSYYPNNVYCSWGISAPFSSVIYIEMMEFALEDTPGCTADYLEIYDGDALDGSSTGKWCGSRPPPNWQSTRQHVFIRFQSDGLITKSGFRLGFSSIYIDKQSTAGPSDISFGLVSAIIVVAIVMFTCLCCCIVYRRLRQGRRSNLSQAQSMSTQPRQTAEPLHPAGRGPQSVYTIGGDPPAQNTPPANFLPPPSYDEVISKDLIDGTGPSPPSYSSVHISSTPKEDNDQTGDGVAQTQL